MRERLSLGAECIFVHAVGYYSNVGRDDLGSMSVHTQQRRVSSLRSHSMRNRVYETV